MTKKKTMIDKKVVSLVKEWAGGYCEKCGLPATDSMALHHRKLRSRGGKDTPANLLVVHHSCHNLATDSIHLNPEKAENKGWMCPGWKEPEDHVYVTPEGSFALLDNEGNIKILGKA